MKRIRRTRGTAEYINRSPSFLEKLRVYGGGPRFIRLGLKAVAYDLDDVDRWLEERKVSSTSAARPEAAGR